MSIGRISLFFAIGLSLCACGIKPGSLEAPEGVEKDTFPRSYPDISTDSDYK